jgi:transposase
MRVIKHVGLDVHAASIAVAVVDGEGIRELGKVPHDVPTLKKLLAKIGEPEELRIVYEAGPTGFGLCRALRSWGADCVVIAPSLMPTMSGDRVKTDRRDALKLAQFSFGKLLQEVHLPEPEQEALRDLVRAREAAKKSQTQARHQLSKFLLRHAIKSKTTMTNWGAAYMAWLPTLRLNHSALQHTLEEYLAEVIHQTERVRRIEGHIEKAAPGLGEEQQAVVAALQGFKGVRFLSSISIVSEIGDMTRFSHPTALMSYVGVVPSENSSGDSVRRGAITKSGNAHLRRVVGEAAWAYARGIATPGPSIRQRRAGLSPAIVEIQERADHRLRTRFRALSAKGKHRNKVVTAVAREFLGFIWAAAVQAQVEVAQRRKAQAAA